MTVAAAWFACRAVRALPVAQQSRTAVLYAIGITAAYWSFARVASIVV